MQSLSSGFQVIFTRPAGGPEFPDFGSEIRFPGIGRQGDR